MGWRRDVSQSSLASGSISWSPQLNAPTVVSLVLEKHGFRGVCPSIRLLGGFTVESGPLYATYGGFDATNV